MDTLTLKQFLSGAILVSSWAIALFFLRFWIRTRDRLFTFFSLSFLLLGVERIANLMILAEFQPAIYLIRLTAFLLLLFGILDKNRRP
jgi:hypothetical protein